MLIRLFNLAKEPVRRQFIRLVKWQHRQTGAHAHTHFLPSCVRRDLLSLLHVHNQSRSQQNTGTVWWRHSSDQTLSSDFSLFLSLLSSTSTLLSPAALLSLLLLISPAASSFIFKVVLCPLHIFFFLFLFFDKVLLTINR